MIRKITSMILITAFVLTISSTHHAFANEQEKLEFGASLEEALGHFRALENNLDEGNTQLAITHATHPIAELYDSIKPTLVEASPSLDAKVNSILINLKDKASTQVSRAAAQNAIEEAKDVIEEARQAVIEESLSNDPKFKLALMKTLLETSIVEYAEAVSDGTIHEMAEFQDGSAFVWRSQQILTSIGSGIDSETRSEMNGMFADLNAAYDAKVDPSKVDELTTDILSEINGNLGVSTKEDRLLDYVETIRMLLGDAKTEYRAGNTDLALSYVTKAYLDNYEFLEMPLVDAGERELMEEIEVMMREELRDMIKSGESPQTIDAHIDSILLRMDTVAVIVPDKLEFGASLEEALGHFRALENNLDEGNTQLAITHATHPIAELYDSIKPTLVEASPSLDAKVNSILINLKDKASTQVSRAAAQNAIEEAKDVIEEARQAVIEESLSNDPKFKLALMKTLLETSIVEYAEAVSDGTIHEMAEFQDGSAFVWRSQQILTSIGSGIDSETRSEMNGMFADLNAAYDAKVDPSKVDELTTDILSEINGNLGVSTKEDRLLDYVETIRMLLGDAKTEYRAGNTDLALSYVTKAYLDNYEFLEMPLVDAGERELMEEIEVMMREELRDMIKSGESPQTIDAQIDSILLRMDTVAVIVPEFGAMAAIVLAIAVVSVVILTTRSKIAAVMPKV